MEMMGQMFDSWGMQKLIAFLGVLAILIGTSAVSFDFSNLYDGKELGPSLRYTSCIRNLSRISMWPFRTLNIKGCNSPLASEMGL